MATASRNDARDGLVDLTLSFPVSPSVMARFLCAVHAPNAAPRAYALVEVEDGQEAPVYTVRDLRSIDVPEGAEGGEPFRSVFDAVNAEPQYAAHTTFVTTGGQRSADAIHEHGPSAVAVTLLGDDGPDTDAHDVSLQVLVDTFERLYRDGAVTVPGSLDAASAAIDAMYGAADLEAAAPDSDRDRDGDLDTGSTTLAGTTVPGRGPSPTVVEQSGSAAPVSTEVVEAPVTADEASAAAVDARRQVGRIATSTGAPAPDLGEAEGTAIALALACWFGEASRDSLPQTDKADEALAARSRQQDRRNPQRS